MLPFKIMNRDKLLIIGLLVCLLHYCHSARTIDSIVQKIYQRSDCRLKDSSALGVGSKTIPDSAITASSEEEKRPPKNARLGDHPGAWTASHANKNQYLQIDLSERKLVTEVATQGRKGSGEYVTEYRIAFSDDGTTWRYYTNEFSMPEVFIGNSDSYKELKNTLKYPIVARYIRFNPVRWMTRISMRVEVFGCYYKSDVASFSDNFISFDVSKQGQTIQREEDAISLRFRTDRSDGVILYADSNQGDYIVIELKRGYLILRINLGSTKESPGATSVTGGSLLDDGQWHDVIVMRDHKDVTLVVDRLETKVHTNGEFFRLDLDKKIFIGGLKQFRMQGLEDKVRSNFIGCLENVDFNGIKMIRDRDRGSRYYIGSGVSFKCRIVPVPPMTFHSMGSRLKLSNRAASIPVRIGLQFRTHNVNNYLIYTLLNKDPTVQDNPDPPRVEVKINKDGHILYLVRSDKYKIQDVLRNLNTDNELTSFSDGLWHTLTIYISKRMVNCTVDRNSKVSERPMDFIATDTYYIGGHKAGVGFLGCMRNIDIDNERILIEDIGESEITNVKLGTCSIRDRCIPNPCEHGGRCRQNWSTFSCMCTGTGYTGVTCRLSSNWLSCFHMKMYSGSKSPEKAIIDVDGSGPLKPFSVVCNVLGKSLQTTTVSMKHDSMERTKVLGFADPGSYHRPIKYDTPYDSMVVAIERAYTCRQFIQYTCNSSRLLTVAPGDSGSSSDQDKPLTYGWWVGRSQQPMYYWGGASYGTHSCYCGLSEQGCRRDSSSSDKWPSCNCDAPMKSQSEDSGYLTDKQHLPVMSLYFGDTGSRTTGNVEKVGWHTLGKLECTGDNLFDNVITFRKLDATIELGTFDARSTGDIWFQFKTTLQNAVLLHNTAKNADDFIMIRILDGTTIYFSYNSGSGTANIPALVASGLSDNRWHTVHIERNRKEASLKVDEQSTQVRSEVQSDEYRTLDLDSALVLGARVDNRDGFVGCIRGMMVNGKLMDLKGIVERGQVEYGVSVGCVGKCDSSPCFHGGTCKEEYNGYTCICAYTPYRGWMCGKEVGANFHKGDFLRYRFTNTSGMSGAAFSHVMIGFSTKINQGILLQIRNVETRDQKLEYISIELDNNGGVKMFVDVGFGLEQINSPSEGIKYTNGQQHILRVTSTNKGRKIEIRVDNYSPAFLNVGTLPDSADTILNNPKYMYIGNNRTDDNRNGFEGCIYSVQFDNIYPLKDAFQDTKKEKHVDFFGNITEDMCGFEEVTQPPDPVEVRKDSGIITHVTMPTNPDSDDDDWTVGKKIGVGFAGALVLVLLLVVVFYFLFRGGVYRTHEARGADYADNPDAALMYNQMGQPELSQVREWFM